MHKKPNYGLMEWQDKYRKILVDSLLRRAEAEIQRKKDGKIRKLEIENAVLKERLKKIT